MRGLPAQVHSKILDQSGWSVLREPCSRRAALTMTQRHFARRALTGGGGNIEIVDRHFDFVRAILPYDYRYTCNAQQWEEAARICQALEGPMISQGVTHVEGCKALYTKDENDCDLCGRVDT